MSPDIGDGARWYCHWHYVVRDHPEWSADFEEFERWQVHWEGYCSPENHFPNAILWEAILGRDPLHGDPHWCGGVTCRHFPIDVTARWEATRRAALPQADIPAPAPRNQARHERDHLAAEERVQWGPGVWEARRKLGLPGPEDSG